MMLFDEPVRMQVLHPKYGVCEVKAYTVFDAKMQAAGFWGMGLGEEDESRVAVETASLPKARYVNRPA